MDLGISGKRAIVAAATAGLGFGAARALAAEGARVAICGRRRQQVDEAAAQLDAVGLVADLSSVAGARRFVAEATEALGGVDILVSNNGGPPPGTALSTPVDAYASALELNLTTQVAMCLDVVEAMRAGGWGRIVAITSLSVRQPIANLVLSNTARAGFTGFLKTLAREVAPDGVTVNSLQPGLHLTDRIRALYGNSSTASVGIPAGVVGDPADFGAFVAWLCSTQARFVTGVQIPVDGGAYAALL